MPIGHPDDADVRRHFFGHTLDTQSFTLAPNEFRGFGYTEAQCDDVMVFRVFAAPGVKVQIHSYGVAGDVYETWELGLDVNWQSGRRIVVQPGGGGVDILLQETTGGASTNTNFQLDGYIGTDQRGLEIRHAKGGVNAQFTPAAGSTGSLVLPECQMYDEVALWLATTAQPAALNATVVENGDGTAGTMHTFTSTLFSATFSGAVFQAKMPTAGIGMRFSARNDNAGNANLSFGYRAYKLG